MPLLKTKELVDRARAVAPAEIRQPVTPGIYTATVEKVESSTKNSNNVAMFLKLESRDASGHLMKIFKLDVPSNATVEMITVAEAEMADFKKAAIAFGFEGDDVENLEGNAFDNRECIVAVDVRRRDDGSKFNVIPSGGWWHKDTRLNDIQWEPRVDEDERPRRSGFGGGRGR